MCTEWRSDSSCYHSRPAPSALICEDTHTTVTPTPPLRPSSSSVPVDTLRLYSTLHRRNLKLSSDSCSQINKHKRHIGTSFFASSRKGPLNAYMSATVLGFGARAPAAVSYWKARNIFDEINPYHLSSIVMEPLHV